MIDLHTGSTPVDAGISTMGNKLDALPGKLTKEQVRQIAGELWNQYIFDAISDENGLVDRHDVAEAASEALMAFQGESVEIRQVTSRRKKSTTKTFKSNQEFGKSLYEKRVSNHKRGHMPDVCRMAHLGELDDMVLLGGMSDANVFETLDKGLDKTPLQIASLFNFGAICDYLIEKGCNVNQQNKEMKTALHYATQAGNWNITRVLVNAGASTDVKDNIGRFAGDYIESDYSIEGYVQKDLSKMQEMKELLTPKEAGNQLYTGALVGKLKNPPSTHIVAVEISDLSLENCRSSLKPFTRSSNSNDSGTGPTCSTISVPPQNPQ